MNIIIFIQELSNKIISFSKKPENKTAFFITLLYAIITFALVQNHEIWSDEAHVFQQLKYKTISELLHYSRGEGHPFLFHAILWPFVKIGVSMYFVQLFCWLASVAAAFCFLTYSPFSLYLKCIVIFSAPFLYAFPVIARNYSMAPLLAFLAASLYKTRADKPVLYASCLLGLAGLHFLLTLPAIYALALFFADIRRINNREVLKKILLVVFLFIWLVYLCADTAFNENWVYKIAHKGDSDTIMALLSNFFTMFTSHFVSAQYAFTNELFIKIGSIFVTVLLSALLFCLFKISKKYFLGSFMALFIQVLVYLFVYSLVYPMRVYCISLFFLFFFWLAFIDKPHTKYNKIGEILLAILFGISIPTGIHMAALDYSKPFSAAKEMAEFIRQRVPKKDLVFASSDFIEGLLYYLPDRDILFSNKEPLRFTLNQKYIRNVNFDEYANKKHHVFMLFLVDDEFDSYNLSVIYKTKEPIKKTEQFALVQMFPEKHLYGPLQQGGHW